MFVVAPRTARIPRKRRDAAGPRWRGGALRNHRCRAAQRHAAARSSSKGRNWRPNIQDCK